MISRAAAIESIEHHIRTGDPLYPLADADRAINYALNVAMSCVENVPAEERRKTGRWIGGENGRCSECGHKGCASDIWDGCKEMFCPSCGAKMESKEVEE